VFLLIVVGFSPVTSAAANWGVPTAIVDGIAACSLLTHFDSMQRGVVDFSDIGYYIGLAVFMVAAAKSVIDGRRGSTGNAIGLVIIAVIVAAADVVLANLPLRVDLTAEKLYTISEGSKAVLAKLDADVTLKYYVSESAADMPVNLKTYAKQVENLLKEYERASGGRLVLEAYDPKPDSDAEEWAQRYGVEPRNVNPFGSPVYFGAVAVCGDREETLPRLAPETEATLEYDLTRLVTRVAWPERPVVGVMTSLDGVLGGGYQQPGWAAFSELAKDYDVRPVETDVEAIDSDVNALVVLHAKDLSDKTLYAIDQFVLGGGRLIACVDPLSIKDLVAARQKESPQMMQMGGDGPSTLGKLFESWGVKFDTSKLACDLSASTKLSMGSGAAEDNPAFLSLGAKNMDEGDLLVSRLTQVMFPFAGALKWEGDDDALKFTPVITTSKDHSCLVDRWSVQFGMDMLVRQLTPDGESRTLAARIDGTFKTAYPQGPDGTNDVSKALSEGKSSVLVFADSDFLADDFCVRILRTPFGNMAQLMNDNLALFSNVIEQFAGREELIGVRSRGKSNRPFVVVDELEAQALSKWQRKEAQLRDELQQTQQRLNALQQQKSGNERMILSKAQQDEIVRFRKVQADTRRQLKNVRKELTSEIDSLGLRLKIYNIVLVPVLVVLFGLFRGYLRKRG